MLVTQRWEREFQAMGTDCHVIVVGASRHLTTNAVDQVADLQARWTRFDPDSEVMMLNRAGSGSVSAATWQLLTCGLVGRRLTGGRFDPFMVRGIVAAGYDRDFAELDARANLADPMAVPAVRHPLIAFDRRRRWVRLADGAQVDSGGLGKGLAADMVSAQLMRDGATACLVNLGGDLRVRGDKGEPWQIGVDSEGPGSQLSVRLASGAVATSSRSHRVWRTSSGTAHHLLDPRTGRPLLSRWAGCTAIAPQAWVAEVLSKTLLSLSATTARRLLRHHCAGGFRQDSSGHVEQL
jgi:thiamine biosynthesis lipoprotein